MMQHHPCQHNGANCVTRLCLLVFVTFSPPHPPYLTKVYNRAESHISEFFSNFFRDYSRKKIDWRCQTNNYWKTIKRNFHRRRRLLKIRVNAQGFLELRPQKRNSVHPIIVCIFFNSWTLLFQKHREFCDRQALYLREIISNWNIFRSMRIFRGQFHSLPSTSLSLTDSTDPPYS